MKRPFLPLLLLAAIAFGFLWRREATEHGRTVEQARVADSTSRAERERAAIAEAEAATLRAERDRFRVATNDASRRVTVTTRDASTAVSAALDAAADDSVTADSLRVAIRTMAAAWKTDSIAQMEREAAWLARALSYEHIVTADSLALRQLNVALAAEIHAHAKTKVITRRGFLARLTTLACGVAVTGGSAWLGDKLAPEAGALVGGAGGYVAAQAVCR